MDFYRPDFLAGESYKFIRMADDLHDLATYMNDVRICFIALTITGYLLLVVYALALCIRRNRRNAPRRRNWDYPNENQRDFSSATPAANDELTSVRTDTQGYMGRNHHSRVAGERQPPSFMRHGHMNHQQQTTRLISDHDGGVVKHQIPHITTTDPPAEKSNSGAVPQLVADSVEMS